MAKNKQGFLKRITKNYKVSVFDNSTLAEVYSSKISKLKVSLLIAVFFIVSIILVVSLFFYTPLKYSIPDYPSLNLRNSIVNNAIMLDSLSAEIELRDRYLEQIQTIISGGIIEEESISDEEFESVGMAPMASDTIFESLISPERYRFSSLMSVDVFSESPRVSFFPPVKGVVTNRFDASPGHFGVDIVADENSPIVAILDGTVIFAEWSITTGFVVQIQHNYNLVSIYKHNSEVMVKPGDKVKPGQIIAIMGNAGLYSTGPHLHIELWQNGVPLNPEDFINF
jgi:murein DD-endopeptidase MepM/ murein hydrolase activator NlpD